MSGDTPGSADDDARAAGKGGGIIGVFARHPTAANLLMVMMLLAGLISIQRMNTQFFPDFGIDLVVVSVEWPGASAEDVDQTIVQAIEREVRFIDGVDRVLSTAREGLASVSVEFESGADMSTGLSNVESAVGQVTTLPENSERPRIRRAIRYDPIASVLLTGADEHTLKETAKRMRDALIARGIDKIDLAGVRDEEIWVEVEPEALNALELSIGDVAAAIRRASQDMPAGEDEGTGAVRQVRALGLAETAADVAGIAILSGADGRDVRLDDIAVVSERFDDDAVTLWRDGRPAVELQVQRSTTADALATADILDAYVAEVAGDLPSGVELAVFNVQSDLIRGRIGTLVENGATGLILVLAVLMLFLNLRVAFWVGMGIPTALLAATAAMYLTGQSINMISLFGLILVLGIVVDDAIVVGEHAEARARAGYSGIDAAVGGATRMAAPVLSSTLTTIAAFMPLFMVGDIIGTIVRAIPFVVVVALFASLVECFLVLPGHMRSALTKPAAPGRMRQRFDRGFDRFREGWFRAGVTRAVEFRYTTLAVALGFLVVSVGLVVGGRLGFSFFPTAESSRIYANVELVAAANRADTERAVEAIERAAWQAAETLGRRDVVMVAVGHVGTSAGRAGGQGASGDRIGAVSVELLPSEEREIRTVAFIDAWRAAIPPIIGANALTVTAAAAGPPGREIDVRLYGDDLDALKAAAVETIALIDAIPGTSDAEDDLPLGRPEVSLRLSPAGEAMGFTTESIGSQVRDALAGNIAQRFARGDEEVQVRVVYPQDTMNGMALADLRLVGTGGHEVPLSEAVELDETRGFAEISREDGRRQVAVTGEVDEAVTTGDAVLEAIRTGGIEAIAERHGVAFRFAGKAEEQAETFADMRVGLMIGLVSIYVVLAWVFASFALPLTVMAIIPFGFVGAAFGHLLMGFDLTFLSIVALLGLSGILVNDSIVLLTSVQQRARNGEALIDAIVGGAVDRLRAVILTSATTIGGLTPLIFETSLEAQFLIPMAVTFVFGLMVATAIVLFLVPSMVMIGDDLKRAGAVSAQRLGRAWRKKRWA